MSASVVVPSLVPSVVPSIVASVQEPITTIGEFFAAGGLLMYPILACSIVVVGLAIERYVSLRRGRLLPRAVVDAVGQIREGRANVVAEPIAEANAPAARVLAAGLRRRGHALADVEKAMEDQLSKEGVRLRANIRGISLMAAVAPLLGLLGTVVGIAEAFAVFAAVEQAGGNKHENLAAGIKVALYTTIFGLCVAIPATLLAAHLNGRARSLLLRVSEALSPAIEPLAAHRQEESHAA